MLINATHDYALRMCCYLARKRRRESTRDIAEATGVSRQFLTQLAQPLRDAGILDARVGKGGGYMLAKDPSEVSVLDVMRAVDEATAPEHPSREAMYVKRQLEDALECIRLPEVM